MFCKPLHKAINNNYQFNDIAVTGKCSLGILSLVLSAVESRHKDTTMFFKLQIFGKDSLEVVSFC